MNIIRDSQLSNSSYSVLCLVVPATNYSFPLAKLTEDGSFGPPKIISPPNSNLVGCQGSSLQNLDPSKIKQHAVQIALANLAVDCCAPARKQYGP